MSYTSFLITLLDHLAIEIPSILFFQIFLIKMTCLRKEEALIFHKFQICFYSRIVKLCKNLSLLHCFQVNFSGKNALICIVL